MTTASIIGEVARGSLALVAQLALILIVIMIIVEIFKEYNLLDKLTLVLSPVTKIIKLPPEGNLPLLAGMVLGIAYGGAIIIESARQGKLEAADIFLVNLFLVICHSLVEDTLIWLALGARVIPIQIARFFLAIIICCAASWYISKYRRARIKCLN
ncbi:MAG: nucleoside recognition protein [Syntrophomonadaceae bacterium]|nr:nucleoside recognition protein [Syntrophomonadaceae bacterium]MDD3890014.1 nucleoside recognition protein [Syntrophomonadaceae bacterium]